MSSDAASSAPSRSPRPAGRSRAGRRVGVVGGVVVVGALGVAALLFQPWKVWVDDRVDQAAPEGAIALVPVPVPVPSTVAPATAPLASAAAPGSSTTPVPPAAAPPPAETPATTFVSIDHETRGSIEVLRGVNGETYVRFVDLDTSNGPDLKVYLSANPHDGPEGAFDDDFVDLGRLQGNIGSQNYVVPAGTELGRFRSVVIWCDRFNSAFGAAPLA